MSALIAPVFIAVGLWLFFDAWWRSRGPARAAETAPEDMQAKLDPAEVHPGIVLLRPAAAQTRLAAAAALGIAGLALFVLVGFFTQPGPALITLVVSAPLAWGLWRAIAAALETVIATPSGVLHRTWRGPVFYEWSTLQQAAYHRGKLTLAFDSGFLFLHRNLRGRGWLAGAARRALNRRGAPRNHAGDDAHVGALYDDHGDAQNGAENNAVVRRYGGGRIA